VDTCYDQNDIFWKEAMGDIFDLIGHAAEGMAGWRYLLSSSFRHRTHARWREQSRLIVAFDIIGYVGSFICVTIIGAALVFGLFSVVYAIVA
jgi:hypothetical protein